MRQRSEAARAGRRGKKAIVWLLVASILLTTLNSNALVSYAEKKNIRIDLGGSVHAVLRDDGILMIKGSGDTYDFLEETAPFLEYTDRILRVEIEEGITSIGDYLLYNCGKLTGTLLLPERLVRIGDCAFSGDTYETAPKFSEVINAFTYAEIPEELFEDAMLEEETKAAEKLPEKSEAVQPENEDTGQSGEIEATETEAAETETSGAGETEPEVSESGAEDSERSTEPKQVLSIECHRVPTVTQNAGTDQATPAEADKQKDESTASGSGSSQHSPKATRSEATKKENWEITCIEQQIIGDEIFFGEQSGLFWCEDTNESFAEAALVAGYEQADQIIELTLADGQGHDITEQCLAADGELEAPQLPEPFTAPENDEVFTWMFDGWELEDGSIVPPGEMILIEEAEEFCLFAHWEREAAPLILEGPVVTQEVEGSRSYTVKTLENERYVLRYQWYVSEDYNGGEPEQAVWEMIAEAVSPVYTRAAQPGDDNRYFRCEVNLLPKAAFFRSVSENNDLAITQYSEPIAGESDQITITYYPNLEENETGVTVSGEKEEGAILCSAEIFNKTAEFAERTAYQATAGKGIAGWNTKADGSGTSYAPGMKANQSMELYAVWRDLSTGHISAEILNSLNDTVPVAVLTESGATVENWAFTDSKILNINLMLEKAENIQGKPNQVIITLPLGMDFVSNGYPTKNEELFSSYKMEPITAFPPKYSPDNPAEVGGTLTYTLNPNAVKGNIKIYVRYDEKLWNKQSQTNVTGDLAPIEVQLIRGDTVEKKVLSSITTPVWDIGNSAKGQSYYSYWNNVSMVNGTPLDKLTDLGSTNIYIGRWGELNATRSMYWKKLTVIQEVPYMMTDGGKIYADYAELKYSNAINKMKTDEQGTSYVEMVLENENIPYTGPRYNVSCTFFKEKFPEGATIIFPEPELIVQGYYGAAYKIPMNHMEPKKITISNKPNMTLKPFNENSVRKFPSNAIAGVVYPLADFMLENEGGLDTGIGKIELEFSPSEEGLGIGVTTVALPIPKEESVAVTCIYMDKNGNTVGNPTVKNVKSDSDTLGVIFVREYKDRYIKKISYETNFPAMKQYYTNSSPWTSAGGVFGTPTGEKGSVNVKMTFSKADNIPPGNQEGEAIYYTGASVTDHTTIKKGKSVEDNLTTMIIDTTKAVSAASIPAGGTVSVTAHLQLVRYPYGNNRYVNEPVFYVRLPADGSLSLVTNSVKVDRDGVAPVVQSPLNVEAGYALYPITMGTDSSGKGLAALDFGGEDLLENTATSSLTLTLTLKASENMPDLRRFNVRDIICAGARDTKIEAFSGQIAYKWEHSLTGGDVFSAGMERTTYSSSYDQSFSVTAGSSLVPFTSAIKDASAPDSAYTDTLELMGMSGNLNYRVSFDNNMGGKIEQEQFYYLIPVLKQGEPLHVHMSKELPTLSMALTGPLKLSATHTELYDVRYCYRAGSGIDNTDFTYYNNGMANFEDTIGEKKYAKYMEAGEIPAEKWGEVGAIKIIARKDIEDGEKASMTLPLEYNLNSGNKVVADGTEYQWSSCGQELYTNGSAATQAHATTNRVAVTVHPKNIEKELVLTATEQAYGKRDEVRKATVTLPAYQLEKELTVESIEISDKIKLVTSDTLNGIRNNADSGTTFHITAQRDTSSVDLSGGGSMSLGTTRTGVESVIEFTLDNTEALETLNPAGYVTVNLKIKDSDIKIKVNMIINTVAKVMREEDIQAGIIMGKRYTDFISTEDPSKAVKITAESAVSVQFDFQNYLGSSYSTPYVQGMFTPGISVILADVTNGNAPEYFYYINQTGSTVDKLFLSGSSGSFVRAGTGTPFNLDEQEHLNHKMILILDYAQATGTIAENQSISLVFPVKEEDGGVPQECRKNISWTVSGRRGITLKLDANKPIDVTDKQFTVSGSATVPQLEANDTYHMDSKLTLAFELFKDESKGQSRIAYPAGTKIKVTIGDKEVTYGTQSNLCLVSLGNIQVGTTVFTADFDTSAWRLPEGDYVLKASIYASKVEAYIPQGAAAVEEAAKLTVKDPIFGLKANRANENHLIEAGESRSIQIQYQCSEGDPKFSAVLYKKSGTGYVSQSACMVSQLPGADGNGSLTVKMTVPTNAKERETYRMAVTMEAGGKTFETTYNLIIYVPEL